MSVYCVCVCVLGGGGVLGIDKLMKWFVSRKGKSEYLLGMDGMCYIRGW